MRRLGAPTSDHVSGQTGCSQTEKRVSGRLRHNGDVGRSGEEVAAYSGTGDGHTGDVGGGDPADVAGGEVHRSVCDVGAREVG